MRKDVGLWIDHKEAVIVTLADNAETTRVIASKSEGDPDRYIGTASDDRRHREFTGHLNVYYDAVIAAIRDADSILMFGPGEAKGELKKRLEKDNLGARIAAVETTVKMTTHQVAAKTRQYFFQ